MLELDLEALVGTTATRLLELPGRGVGSPAVVGLDTAVCVNASDTGTVAEVLDGFTGVLLATEKHDVRCLGVPKCELVEGEAFTAGVCDPGPSASSELKRADAKFAEVLRHTDIIGDSAYNYSSLALLALHEASQSGNRERGAVGARLEKALEDLLVLLGVGTTRKERVELYIQ